jgi:hypothetical protein
MSGKLLHPKLIIETPRHFIQGNETVYGKLLHPNLIIETPRHFIHVNENMYGKHTA